MSLAALFDRLFPRDPEPWMPECPEAQIEVRMARRITWDYDRFRYHLDRALELEKSYRAAKAARSRGLRIRYPDGREVEYPRPPEW